MAVEAFQKGYSPEEEQNDPEMSKIKDAPELQAWVREFGSLGSGLTMTLEGHGFSRATRTTKLWALASEGLP